MRPRLASWTLALSLTPGALLSVMACSSGTPSGQPGQGQGGNPSNAAGAPAVAGSNQSTGGSAPGGGGTAGTSMTDGAGGSSEAGTAGTDNGGQGEGGNPPTAGGGGSGGGPPNPSTTFWPDNKVAAVTLTYDDGLDGQLKNAIPVLDARGLKGTFFLASFQGVAHIWALPDTTSPLTARHEAWLEVAANGHEIAGHTIFHPCDDNNPGFRPEDYTLDSMATELDESLLRMARVGGAAPFTFAYPCGGDRRGLGVDGASASYAPLIPPRFLAARVSQSGIADPETVVLTETPQMGFGETTDAELLAVVDEAIAAGGWAVFAFHGIGQEEMCDINTFDLDACALNYLTTQNGPHVALADYLVEKSDQVWTATMKDVALHIQGKR